MKSDDVFDPEGEYVVVDLPVRLRPHELAMLNAAAARARTRSSMGVRGDTIDQALLARGTAARLNKLLGRRERVFGDKLFPDPTWNMLLELFVRRIDKQLTSISVACLVSGVPARTALRFIESLVESGIVVTDLSSTDQQAHRLELTDEGFQKMLDVLTPE